MFKLERKPYTAIYEGSLFKVINDCGLTYTPSIGTIVELIDNDGTECPLFRTSDGTVMSIFWDNLAFIPDGVQIPETFIRIDTSNESEEEEEETIDNPLDIQVGGDHYKDFKIQPVEFIEQNNLGFLQGCIVKRISRYDKPTGKGLQDLLKIKHEVDLLIELKGLS